MPDDPSRASGRTLSSKHAAISRILASGDINPDADAFLAGLLETVRRYCLAKALRTFTPAKELARCLRAMSASASRLAENLDGRSPLDGEIRDMLRAFGIDAEEVATSLRRLERAANDAAVLRMGIGVEKDAVDGAVQAALVAEDFLSNIPGPAVFARDLAGKGNTERPETGLFIDLRELFTRLGGTPAIGSLALYRFVKASVELFSRDIPIPDPEPFRVLMTAALKRRGADLPHRRRDVRRPSRRGSGAG
jgi:hypothetical protein